MKKILFSIIFLGLSLSLAEACSSQNISKTEPTASLPVQPSTQPASPTTTLQPTTKAIKLPKMVLINPNDGIGLTYINLQGQAISEVKTPGISFPGPDHVHIAGSLQPGPIQVPLVYFAYQPDAALMVNTNDQVEFLLKSRYFDSLAGAEGLPVIAFTFLNPLENGLESKLFVSTLKNIPQSVPVFTQVDSQNSLSIVPIAVDAQGELINGVWFTRRPWGIGGDIVFDPFGGLFYYDHANRMVKEILDVKQDFQGLAQDRSLAASMEPDKAAQGFIKVTNIRTGGSFSLPLDASSDRGGGYVEFSPDDRFIAWMEASGSQMSDTPNFHSRIRVAELGTTPGLVRDVTDTSLAKALGYAQVSRMQPVGWLDNQTVLIEVRQESWEKAALVKLDIASGNLSEFSQGSFVGFGYE